MQFIKALSVVKDILDLLMIGFKQFKKYAHENSIKKTRELFAAKRNTRKEKITNVKDIANNFNDKFS